MNLDGGNLYTPHRSSAAEPWRRWLSDRTEDLPGRSWSSHEAMAVAQG